jgi:thymidylate kinase
VKHPHTDGVAGAIRALILGHRVGRLYDDEDPTVLLEAGQLPTPDARHYLFLAEVAETHATVIDPALQRDAIVFYDRTFWTTNLAFRYAEGVASLGEMVMRNMEAEKVAGYPDWCGIIDVPVETARQRMLHRSGEASHFDRAPIATMALRREGFTYAEGLYDWAYRIDGEGDAATVNARVLASLDAHFGW